AETAANSRHTARGAGFPEEDSDRAQRRDAEKDRYGRPEGIGNTARDEDLSGHVRESGGGLAGESAKGAGTRLAFATRGPGRKSSQQVRQGLNHSGAAIPSDFILR